MGKTALLGPWVSSNRSLRPGKLGLSDQGQQCARPAHAVPCNCPLEKPTRAATGLAGGSISYLCSATVPYHRITIGQLGLRLFLPIGHTAEVNILSLPTGLGAGDDVH